MVIYIKFQKLGKITINQILKLNKIYPHLVIYILQSLEINQVQINTFISNSLYTVHFHSRWNCPINRYWMQHMHIFLNIRTAAFLRLNCKGNLLLLERKAGWWDKQCGLNSEWQHSNVIMGVCHKQCKTILLQRFLLEWEYCCINRYC